MADPTLSSALDLVRLPAEVMAVFTQFRTCELSTIGAGWHADLLAGRAHLRCRTGAQRRTTWLAVA